MSNATLALDITPTRSSIRKSARPSDGRTARVKASRMSRKGNRALQASPLVPHRSRHAFGQLVEMVKRCLGQLDLFASRVFRVG